MTPKLDYVPRLDDRNKLHRVAALQETSSLLEDTSVFWQPPAIVLNQYAEGACVGGGVTHARGTRPGRGKIFNQMMFDVYNRAKQIDEWEGVDYEGTSVRAGMMVGRENGWWTGFKWAFDTHDVRAALETGPLVIGVEWREGMYTAFGGQLRPKGKVVGGHCVVLTGYTRHHKRLGGPAFRIRNSWGDDWGLNGSAYIKVDDLNLILFEAGGEAAVPIGKTS